MLPRVNDIGGFAVTSLVCKRWRFKIDTEEFWSALGEQLVTKNCTHQAQVTPLKKSYQSEYQPNLLLSRMLGPLEGLMYDMRRQYEGQDELEIQKEVQKLEYRAWVSAFL